MKALVRRLYKAALTTACSLYALAARGGSLLAGRRPPASTPETILVLRFGLLGDGTALLSPTLRRLREAFPRARIDVLATPLQRPLLEALPDVDRVLTWEAGDLTEPRQALRRAAWGAARTALMDLRRERYDLALACYGRLASAVALLSGAPRRIGYRDEAYPFALTGALPGKRYDRPGWHEADYGVALVHFAAGRARSPGNAGGSTPAGPPLRLRVSPEGREALRALLEPDRLRAGAGKLIVLHPGATNGRAKQWPLPHWIDLARRARGAGHTVVLCGGQDERHLAGAIKRGAAGGRGDPGLIDLSGRTSLPALLALLEQADASVSGDSGPMHLAVAVDCPVLAIHGPTDPGQSGPYRARRAIVLRHNLPCSPCYSLQRVADCPLGHTLCQRLVEPESAFHALLLLLEG